MVNVPLPAEFGNLEGGVQMAGMLYVDGDALMGYVLSQLHLNTFDNSDAGGSVAGNVTVVVRTINGKGVADVVLDGTGSALVQMKYSVDGGADVNLAASDQAIYVSLAFTASLALKATNTDSAAHNRCGISSTGVTQ